MVASTSKSELIDTTAMLATVRTSAAYERVRIHGGELLSILTEGTKGLCLYVPIGWLGILAIFLTRDADTLRPANFVISGLTIEPERVDVGKTFTVTVDVSNTGDLTGTHNVELEFVGEVVRNRTATLSGGGSTRITFELLSFEIPEEPGTYTVKVNGQTGTVTVQSPALTIEGYAIIVVMVVGVAVVVIVFLVIRRRATRRPPTYPFPSY